jgi:hypothetical protein
MVDPSKKILFTKKLLKTGRETGISQTAYTPPISTSSVLFSAVEREKLFFDSGVSENTCFSRKFKPLFGASPLDTSQAIPYSNGKLGGKNTCFSSFSNPETCVWGWVPIGRKIRTKES